MGGRRGDRSVLWIRSANGASRKGKKGGEAPIWSDRKSKGGERSVGREHACLAAETLHNGVKGIEEFYTREINAAQEKGNIMCT